MNRDQGQQDAGRAERFDLIVVGTGLAGLSLACELAATHRVALISKAAAEHCASRLAQGGIAAAIGADDSIEQHVDDTLVAGAHLNDAQATHTILGDAGAAIDWLLAAGVAFDRKPDAPTGTGRAALDLTLEGGHSARRIAHVADTSGAAIHQALLSRVRAMPNIVCFEHHRVSRLRTRADTQGGPAQCIGIEMHDLRTARPMMLAAAHTVLATGGAGGLFNRTTSPSGMHGEGLLLAWRAGCRLANLEFIQYHPTALAHPQAAGFLISEALRGEGAILRLPADSARPGHRFMPEHDARVELAPRDIVARAIEHEMRQHDLDHVDLDLRHLPAGFAECRFPAIFARCLALGIDLRTMPIPVSPAVHYFCGGVLADSDGRTDLPGLSALGELACTGLHGANRLASNSLLECVVTARRAAARIAAEQDIQRGAQQPLPAVAAGKRATGDVAAAGEPTNDLKKELTSERTHDAARWARLRQIISAAMGLHRDAAGLDAGDHALEALRHEIAEVPALGVDDDHGDGPNHAPHDNCLAAHRSLALLALADAIDTGRLLIASARQRPASLGAHQRRDHPAMRMPTQPTVLSPARFDTRIHQPGEPA